MKKLILLAFVSALLILQSCSENYSNGERIGLVTQFSQKGVIWKSWEGSLNLTQTGMNSSGAEPFMFSLDNDRADTDIDPLRLKLDSAAQYGWKVKLVYHETIGKNWFKNRGNTDHFINEVQVLDRNPIANAFNGLNNNSTNVPHTGGRVVDTIYVVIDKLQKD